MYEQYFKVKNKHSGEIKLFDTAVKLRLWLKENLEWIPDVNQSAE